jgi:hypothetical protein
MMESTTTNPIQQNFQNNQEQQYTPDVGGSVSSGDNQYTSSQSLFIVLGGIVLTVAFLSIGFVGGYWYAQTNTVLENTLDVGFSDVPNPEELMPERGALEGKVVVEEVEQVVEDDAQFESELLSFVLRLPPVFSNLVMYEMPDTGSGGMQSANFELPVKNGPIERQFVFSIVEYEPTVTLDTENMPASFLAESDRGTKYYFFPAMDMGISENMSEYAVFQEIVQYDLLTEVKNGLVLK